MEEPSNRLVVGGPMLGTTPPQCRPLDLPNRPWDGFRVKEPHAITNPTRRHTKLGDLFVRRWGCAYADVAFCAYNEW
jgi:hypothetical protein